MQKLKVSKECDKMYRGFFIVALLVHYAELSSTSDQTTAVGLSEIEGTIAAYGDFNSDQATDVFIINKDCKIVNMCCVKKKENLKDK